MSNGHRSPNRSEITFQILDPAVRQSVADVVLIIQARALCEADGRDDAMELNRLLLQPRNVTLEGLIKFLKIQQK